VDSLRTAEPQGVVMNDLATQVSEDETFYAKLVNHCYMDQHTKLSHIKSDLHYYDDSLYVNEPKGLTGVSVEDRKVLYERRETGYDHLDIWLPINRDNNNNVPIYVVIRGTSELYDYFKDLNLLHNHYTHSNTDFTDFMTVETTILNQMYEILPITTEKVIFVSHSLGSELALHIYYKLYTYPGNIYTDRLIGNHFFNPFIVVDYVYENSLLMSTNYKDTLKAYIVDTDIFSCIYKNHPIGPVKLYGNLILENDPTWHTFAGFVSQGYSWVQYLDTRNHRIIAFLNENALSYPTSTYVHYIPPDTSAKHIQTRRTYKLLAFGNQFTSEHLQLKSDTDLGYVRWRLCNLNVNSIDENDYLMNMSVADKKQSIFIYNHWAYPLTINNDNTIYFYFIRAHEENNIQYYYLAEVSSNQLHILRPYQNVDNNDYSKYLNEQETHNNSAYRQVTKADLENVVSTYTTDKVWHQDYMWQIVENPPVITSGSTRRDLSVSYYDPMAPIGLYMTQAYVTISTNGVYYTNTGLSSALSGSTNNYIYGYNGTSSPTYATNGILFLTIKDHTSASWGNMERPPSAQASTNPDEFVWSLTRTTGTDSEYTITNSEQSGATISNLRFEIVSYINSNIAEVVLYKINSNNIREYFIETLINANAGALSFSTTTTTPTVWKLELTN
jgi:hypothetical protein